jgi:hypothetical protein
MADMIPFFPRGEASQAVIISSIESFVSTVDELSWLTSAAVNHMRKWESLAELRGLFCTRYKPRDGRRESCSLPGFTVADAEAAYFQRISDENDQKLETWKRELAAAPPGTIEPFVLSPGAVKLLTAPPRPLAEVEAEVKASIGPPRSPEEVERLARELAEEIERRKKV